MVHNMSSEQPPVFSKTLRIESKTIFVDVKENSNGTYLKLAERSTRGDRSTVVMAISGVRELRDALNEVLEMESISEPKPPKPPESAALFVTSVPLDCNEIAIAEHFGQAGQVLNVEVLRQQNGTSLGRALVTYTDPYVAQYAKDFMDKTTLNGELVRCREDRKANQPKMPDQPRTINDHRVYVSNLSWKTTIQDLSKHFETIGLVTECDIKTTKKGFKSTSLGAGFVQFMDSRCCATAIQELNNSELDGRMIAVREYYD